MAMPIVTLPVFIRQLVWAALLLTITHMGTTALALGAGWVRNVIEYRRLSMITSPEETWWKKWWAERRQGIKLSTGIWFFLFLFCCFEAAYQRYKPVADDNHNLQIQLSQLEDYKKSKDQYDHDLAWAKIEVKHWQDAYTELSHGDIHPDRIMTKEQTNILFEALDRIKKDEKNKEYVKNVAIGSVCDGGEPYNLAGQLLSTFHEAHWPVMWRNKLGKEFDLGSRYGFQQIRVTILSDDRNKAQFIAMMLGSAGIEVNDFTWVRELPPKFKGTVIWVGYKS